MLDAAGRGRILIAIAREAISRLEAGESDAHRAHEWLLRPGASFVTLRLQSRLRGCIGSIEPRRALGEDVARNAWAAAYRDGRFPPVCAEELAELQVEVSVLSPREALEATDEREALAALRPGIDGLYLEYGDLGATFLPQVWEGLPDPAQFLDELRRKAGLPARFWHRDLRLSRYTVEKYQ